MADIGGLVFTRPNGQPVHSRDDWQDWLRPVSHARVVASLDRRFCGA